MSDHHDLFLVRVEQRRTSKAVQVRRGVLGRILKLTLDKALEEIKEDAWTQPANKLAVERKVRGEDLASRPNLGTHCGCQ